MLTKTTTPVLFCLLLFSLLSFGCKQQQQDPLMPVQSTIEVDSEDSPDSILLKAAHVVPTQNQLHALKNEFIAFIHFGPNTFTRMEWGTGMEDPQVFDLKQLDTDQWCSAMKAAGMKRVIFTAKHHDGFCLWPTRYTTHGVISSPFENGNGDVLRALSASCQQYGLELGIYLSPADLYQIEHPDGLYGNLSKPSERSIPRPVTGRPFKNQQTFTFEVDDYNEYFLNQLFELLTEYGPIHEVWLDGAHPKRKGGQQYDYLAWKELINTLAPEAVVFGRQDIRWCGNEAGKTRDTEWNIIPYQEDPNAMNHFADLTAKALGGRTELMEGRYLHYQMAETNTSIREGWFYRDERDQKVRSADDVFDMYERSVGGNSIFLLNIPPNREGRFSDEDVAVLQEVGERIVETYDKDLFEEANGPERVLDNNASTYLELAEDANSILITTDQPITLNRLSISEAIATHSERVEAHTFYVWNEDEWQRITKATNIGYKRILRFPEVTGSKFKLTVDKWRLPPAIADVSAHYYRQRPPQLAIMRDTLGQIRITPKVHEFAWKPHGEDIAGNLNKNIEIRYTLDGSEPSLTAALYQRPFDFDSGTIKAKIFTAEDSGSTATAVIGIPKKSWTLLRKDSERTPYVGKQAFDGLTETCWCPTPSPGPHYIAIDLGKEENITGMMYTPPTPTEFGKLERGQIATSLDGKYWMPGPSFKFGNLINDPSPRLYKFEKAIKAKFVKINIFAATGGGRQACISEIDLLSK